MLFLKKKKYRIVVRKPKPVSRKFKQHASEKETKIRKPSHISTNQDLREKYCQKLVFRDVILLRFYIPIYYRNEEGYDKYSYFMGGKDLLIYFIDSLCKCSFKNRMKKPIVGLRNRISSQKLDLTFWI